MEIIKQFKMLGDISKFSWAQAFCDANGKSSMTAITGFIITITGCIGFLFGTFTKQIEIVNQSVYIILIGAGVITGRKIINGSGKASLEEVVSEEK